MSNSSSTSLISELVKATFQANTGAGAISIPGLVAGDVIFNGTINGQSLWNGFSAYFEAVVSVNGQLQQLGGNLTGVNFIVYLIRPVIVL